MSPIMPRIVVALLAVPMTLAFAQEPAGPEFEVASVKPSVREPGKPIRVSFRGGPGTDDPGRAAFENFSISNLINVAFSTDRDYVSGPDGMMEQMFDIEVKVPEGSSKEQFGVMMQNLLRERFHLAYHYEKKEVTTYDLVVAKTGPRFKESAPPPETPAGPPPAPGSAKIGPDGFPVLPAGRGAVMMNNVARMRLPLTMEQLARRLSAQIGSPVSDATGLKGKYDIGLYWSTQRLRTDAGDADPGPSIFDAVREQLGLALQAKKGPIDLLVIDHVDKTPTEN
jgi:uncharacterized protein (TIGR03435 family)